MKSQYRMLFAFVVFLVAIGCVCSTTGTPTPAPVPTDKPTSAPVPTKEPISLPPTSVPQQIDTPVPQQNDTPVPQPLSGSSDQVTFTDQNNLLAFDLPGNWTVEHTELGNKVYSDANAYSDTFTSPDSSGKIESLVILSSTAVNNSTATAAALDLLHKYYSSTGKVGDIRINGDSIMQDGSERFRWKSLGGNYSGYSYFEVRGKDRKTMLMFTTWWSNDADQAVIDTLASDGPVINSYRIP